MVATYQANLPTLLAPWVPLGHVKADGEADLTLAGSRVELRRLQVGVTDASGLGLLKVSALRPFAFDLATQQADVAGISGAVDIARITVGRVPLAALPLSHPSIQLGGAVVQGEFIASVDGPKLAVRSPAAFKLADVSLARAGRPVLTGLGWRRSRLSN